MRRWLRVKGRFYVFSAAGHVVVLALLCAVSFSTRMPKRPLRLAAINTEIGPEENNTFELAPLPKPPVVAPAETELPSDPPEPAGEPAAGDGPMPPPGAPNAALPAETTAPKPPAKPAPPPASPTSAGNTAAAAASERAIAAALDWLRRHQNTDGSWSLSGFDQRCHGVRCASAGDIQSDAAATGLAVMTMLGAGDSPQTMSFYQAERTKAVAWLIEHQRPDGDLSAGGQYRMYGHAVGTIALCQHYGRTGDGQTVRAAQAAVTFIEKAQNRVTGGWHYEPGGYGDTSVLAWQMMALHSARRAGLRTEPASMAGAAHWLNSVAQGRSGGLFCYEPQRPVTTTMTAVGLLCGQFAGASRYTPAQQEGLAYLREHPPRESFGQDVFYWYFAAPVMRAAGGEAWDTWYSRVRRDLINTQVSAGCAAGSWGIDDAAQEVWSLHAGRLLTTCLATQLLELEHGSLPLYEKRSAPAKPTTITAERETPVRR